MAVEVKAKCVMCSATKTVKAGEVPQGEVPMCDKCFSPMVAVSAEDPPSEDANG
jgi:hypothetical protein